MLLGAEGLQPVAETVKGIEMGDRPGWRMKYFIVHLSRIRLLLRYAKRNIHIEVLRLQMAQLMGQDFLLLFLRQARIDVNIKGAVVIWDGDALTGYGECYRSQILVNHFCAEPR